MAWRWVPTSLDSSVLASTMVKRSSIGARMRSRTASAASSRRSRARRTTVSRWSDLKGLGRNATAPACIAFMARSRSRYAVTTMQGSVGSTRWAWLITSIPLARGIV